MAFSWKTASFTNQLFDFKLKNKDGNNNWIKYDMVALILDSNYLKLKSFMAEFHSHDKTDNLVYVYDSTSANQKEINLIEAKQYSQAYFKNDSNEFYFYT